MTEKDPGLNITIKQGDLGFYDYGAHAIEQLVNLVANAHPVDRTAFVRGLADGFATNLPDEIADISRANGLE